MKRVAVGAVAVALAGVGVGTAIGQGQGGTLGPAAVGAKTFEVRIKEKDFGVNCGLDKANRCFRRGPRPANVIAGSGLVYDGGTKVGTAVFFNVIGKKLPKNNTIDVFSATITFNNRQDSLSVLGPSTTTGSTTLPYPIVGGTGAYAGARGTVTEGKGTNPVKGEFRIPLNFTFIP
jgi:hypothetical protein